MPASRMVLDSSTETYWEPWSELSRYRLSSDHGAQYTSRLLAEWARDNDVRLSCSRTGNCHDNAVAESFFATLKNEMHYRRSFTTRGSAKHAVIEFIEAHHNRRRPHSTIGYKAPAEAMAAFFERTAPSLEAMPMAA